MPLVICPTVSRVVVLIVKLIYVCKVRNMALSVVKKTTDFPLLTSYRCNGMYLHVYVPNLSVYVLFRLRNYLYFTSIPIIF